MKLILVNGPPRSGKDTAGELLRKSFSESGHNIVVTKLAKALKEMAHGLIGYPNARHDAFELVKDQPQTYLRDKTWRQVYIAVSEQLAKPLWGQDYWARRLIEELDLLAYAFDTVVVTDCGFQTEVDTLVDWAKDHGHTVVLIRMMRVGCDFSKDSRGYVDLRGRGPDWGVNNNGTIDQLRVAVEHIARLW